MGNSIRDYFHSIQKELNIILNKSDDVNDDFEDLKKNPNSPELLTAIATKLTQIRNSSLQAKDMITRIKYPTYMLADGDVSLDELEERIKVKFKEISILVIEDEPVQCQWLESILSQKGFKVTIANTMVDAINFIDINTYHLVVLDLHVPAVKNGTEISMGTEILDALKNNSKGTQIIVITAENDENILHAIEKYNPVRIISKPASRDKLMAALTIAVTKAVLKFVR